ncbi:MAG: prepilin-type N-terminal cleavage/methylation domain-containing protein, partial [Lachnospiraceae bacterium]|nr:prepilin-type N-terminal cleavage/methylation domain-containing protein [Lachnospiraceae bacterium]
MFKKAKKNKKGFTLAELLIVVAIIAVLVAISIPIFTTQLEKARESTDAANLRAAYATASVKVLESESKVSAG